MAADRAEAGARTTAEGMTDADRRDREPRDRPAATAAATSSEPVYEEVLTPRVAGGVLTFVAAHALLFSLPISVLILLYFPASAAGGPEAAALSGLASGGFGAAWGAAAYYRMRVYVEVTESGVEIVRNWNSRRGAPQVTIPFAGINGVEAAIRSGRTSKTGTATRRTW